MIASKFSDCNGCEWLLSTFLEQILLMRLSKELVEAQVGLCLCDNSGSQQHILLLGVMLPSQLQQKSE